jgi:hypothetical protein
MNATIISWYADAFKKHGPLINEAIASQMCEVGTSCITKWKKKGKVTVYKDPDGRTLLSFDEIRDIAISRMK